MASVSLAFTAASDRQGSDAYRSAQSGSGGNQANWVYTIGGLPNYVKVIWLSGETAFSSENGETRAAHQRVAFLPSLMR